MGKTKETNDETKVASNFSFEKDDHKNILYTSFISGINNS